MELNFVVAVQMRFEKFREGVFQPLNDRITVTCQVDVAVTTAFQLGRALCSGSGAKTTHAMPDAPSTGRNVVHPFGLYGLV